MRGSRGEGGMIDCFEWDLGNLVCHRDVTLLLYTGNGVTTGGRNRSSTALQASNPRSAWCLAFAIAIINECEHGESGAAVGAVAGGILPSLPSASLAAHSVICEAIPPTGIVLRSCAVHGLTCTSSQISTYISHRRLHRIPLCGDLLRRGAACFDAAATPA